MDIASATDQSNAIMSYAGQWNNLAHQTNQKAQEKYASTIQNAKTKQSLLKGYDEGGIGLQSGATLMTGAKVYGNARNFDSEVAGFGKGKGTSGYLASQGQIARGRIAQGKQTIQTAVGMRDADDVAKSGADLGLQRTIEVPGLTPWDVPADESKIADATEQGKAVAKASGGLLSVEKGSAEGGVVGGIVKKAGKFITDMPEGQLGAVADVAGKVAGIYSAGKGIYDDVAEHSWSTDTTAQKWANVGDIVAGGLDAVSMALPVLAPVGAVASAISSGLDIGASADDEKKTDATAKTTQSQESMTGTSVGSLSSAGLVAKQQLSAY